MWDSSIYMWTAFPFLLLYLTALGKTSSKGGATCIARKMTAILLAALSTIQMWTLGSLVEELITTEGVYIVFSCILALAPVVYKFSRSRKWMKLVPLNIFWLFLIVTSSISVQISIQQETYRKDAMGLLLPLCVLALVLGHVFLSFSRDEDTTPFVTEDGSTQAKLPLHPEDEASFLSKIYLDWVFSVVWAGYKTKLQEEDVPEINVQNKCETVFPAFEQGWAQEELKCQQYNAAMRLKLKRGPSVDSGSGNVSGETDESRQSCNEDKEKLLNQRASLLRVLIRIYGLKYFILQFLCCAVKLSEFIYPLMIESLMKYVENRDSEPLWRGYSLVVVSCLARIFSDSMYPRLWISLRRLIFEMKMVITVAVYKKALTLSNDSRKEKTAGQLISLISEDLDKIVHAMEDIYLVVLTPIQTVVAIWLLYNLLGSVALVALVFLLCLIPLNYWLGRKLEDLEETKNEVKDDRVKVMNEVLNGIKVLKLYAWEKSFIGKICSIRHKEMVISKKIDLCYTGLDFIFKAMLFLVRFMGLISVVILGDHLDASKAFLIVTLFLLLSYPFSEVAVVVPACVQARVSLSRINNFLTDKDISKDAVNIDTSAEAAITIKAGIFAWDPIQRSTLKSINLEIPKGGLVAVVGMVGSGKSSLLSAMLGEMEKMDGSVTVQSSIAYVSQEAWIQNATLRDNILFGSKFNAQRYKQVIRACALKDDFKILAAGDKTEIGEKGINLSGGQKQRVSLARAVYSGADIYLFDDPLSAVDAHVGKHIFNKVIGHSGILKNKTRILVTHGVHWLPFVDNIVVMKDGMISECGTYKQLLTHTGAFTQFLKEVFLHEEEENDTEVEQIKKNIFTRLISLDEDGHPPDVDLPDEEANSTIDAEPTSRNGSSDDSDKASSENSKGVIDGHKKLETKGKIIDDEDTEFGSVGLTVYKEYLMTIGPYWIVLFGMMFGAMLVSREFSTLWVGQWTEDPLMINVSLINSTEYRTTLWTYISVYAFCGIAEIVLAFSFSLVICQRSRLAATNLHTKLLSNILHYPMAFFDTTPSGRILNRFSKDIDSVDRLGNGLDGYIQCAGEVLTNLFMAIYIAPKLIPYICVTSGAYVFLQCVYIPCARQLRRYSSKFSSPVFVHFKETLDGTQTLRAFKAQHRFVNKMKRTIEERLKFDLMQRLVHIWFIMKISTLSQLVSLAAGLVVIWDESISPSRASMLLSFSIWFVESLGWFVNHSSYTEQELVSLERVIEYSNKPKEAAWEVQEMTPAREWPQKGEIVLDDYQARYRDGLDLVLRGVTCSIRSGEKIGIVGRTGAGKSSLTVALFRLVEAAAGQINVDECQIAKLGLHDLRKKITILPQDPVIFGGSLRMNLDPFNEKSTEELWEALKHSHLQALVESLPGKLDYECGEAGKNLSVGQRQLVCLARTLLRKTKILVLDEATAAVDRETDDLIQKTICNEFKDCTVLTIAHRLNTILDYDRVLVMDQGLVKEFDSPKNLLANPESAFYGMAKDANLI